MRCRSLSRPSRTGHFALLRPGRHVLLDFAHGTAASAVASLLQEFDGEPRVVIGSGTLAEPRADWSEVTAALIRPDGHVAWASAQTDPPTLAVAARTATEALRG